MWKHIMGPIWWNLALGSVWPTNNVPHIFSLFFFFFSTTIPTPGGPFLKSLRLSLFFFIFMMLPQKVNECSLGSRTPSCNEASSHHLGSYPQFLTCVFLVTKEKYRCKMDWKQWHHWCDVILYVYILSLYFYMDSRNIRVAIILWCSILNA